MLSLVLTSFVPYACPFPNRCSLLSLLPAETGPTLPPQDPFRSLGLGAFLDAASLAKRLSWVNYITAQAGGDGGVLSNKRGQRTRKRSLESPWVW